MARIEGEERLGLFMLASRSGGGETWGTSPRPALRQQFTVRTRTRTAHGTHTYTVAEKGLKGASAARDVWAARGSSARHVFPTQMAVHFV
jgi:hypothetical protein